jgi:oligopeptide/dipeptide ABC transporter ATP-binding protein
LIEGEPFAEPLPLARRARVQTVFQDTLGALNPSLTIRRQMLEPLAIHQIKPAAERAKRGLAALQAVGLGGDVLDRYPHEVSGGQRQRIVLARALMLKPSLLICDEAVSALDVSVQAQVINLLACLLRDQHLACLFISHDLRVVDQLCDRIGVMYLGRLIETGPRAAVFDAPRHPYTRVLVGSLPAARPRERGGVARLCGEPPSPLDPPPGCAFHPRCSFAVALCASLVPPLRHIDGRMVACHRAEEI